jgi:uncharacterized protein YdhG (YjbR/CyaY superfamily)
MKAANASDPSHYIASFPAHTQKLLKQLRSAIKKAAPKAEEVISYRMPAFRLNGILVWYAGYKAHIGFYPCASSIKAFKEELKPYKTSKGAIQFPLDKPIPLKLVERIVKFRVQENQEKQRMKGVKNKK